MLLGCVTYTAQCTVLTTHVELTVVEMNLTYNGTYEVYRDEVTYCFNYLHVISFSADTFTPPISTIEFNKLILTNQSNYSYMINVN